MAPADLIALFGDAARGRCPRCAQPTLFAGPVAFAPRCPACGLDYDQFNVGDGPAALLTLVVGAVVVTGAVAIQLAWDPPLWIQMLVWIPLSAALVVGLLRVAKGALLLVEYRTAAREGRITDESHR